MPAPVAVPGQLQLSLTSPGWGNTSFARLALTDDGGFVAAWWHDGPGGTKLFVARFGPDGVQIDEPVERHHLAGPRPDEPVLLTLDNGNVALIADLGDLNTITAVTLDPVNLAPVGGGMWLTSSVNPQRILTDLHAVVALPGGRFGVVWTVGTATNLTLANADGNGGATIPLDMGSGGQRLVIEDGLAVGDLFIFAARGAAGQVLRFLDAQGQVARPDITLATDVRGKAAMTGLAGDGFAVAYFRPPQNGEAELLRLVRFDAGGNQNGTHTDIVFPGRPSGEPAYLRSDLLELGNGDLLVTAGALAQVVNPDGSLDGPPRGLGVNSLLGLAPSGNDDFIVASIVAATNGVDLMVSRFDTSGTTSPAIVIGTAANETLVASAAGDTLAGASGSDSLLGLAGADSLDGGFGEDTLRGGEGADTLQGGGGNDQLYGEGGDDHLSSAGGIELMSGGAGNDTLRAIQSFRATLDGGDGDDLISVGFSAASVLGGAGDDTLIGILMVSPQDDTLDGSDGADRLQGGGGNDILRGGEGDDRLFGDDGADSLVGSAGADRGFGGGGDDTLFGGDGDDRLEAGDGADNLDGGEGADLLLGNADNDSAQGGTGHDSLYGGDGADTLSGGEQDDRVQGEAGDDLLFGGAGADRLFGDAGADTLVGGAGADTLRGGDGADLFRFTLASDSSAATPDLIAGFQRGIDRIDLSAFGVTFAAISQSAVPGGRRVTVELGAEDLSFALNNLRLLTQADFIFD